jgi:hypothetical protein
VYTSPLGTRRQLTQDVGRRGDVSNSGVGKPDPAVRGHLYGPVRRPARAASLALAGLELVRKVERE